METLVTTSFIGFVLLTNGSLIGLKQAFKNEGFWKGKARGGFTQTSCSCAAQLMAAESPKCLARALWRKAAFGCPVDFLVDSVAYDKQQTHRPF